MKITQFVLTVLLGALLINPIASQAEDVDIYSGLSGTANIPNVMIIMDNAANSDASMSTCTYWDGTSPASSKSIDNYMCALDNIVHGMSLRTDGTALVNLGITIQSGVYLKLTPVDDNAYTGTYTHTSGQTNRQVIVAALRAITKFSGQATQGDSFQETWAYYTGGNGGTTGTGVESGITYPGTNVLTGCQKNYVIFISGVTSSAHAHTGSELAPLTAAVKNAVAASNIAAAQGTALLTQITPNGENPWAGEWARFMYNVDNVAAAAGVQGITSYSIAAGSPVYPAAMGSMETYIYNIAKYGGGKYFAATTFTSIKDDILKILNEVQAVNSVFASSSLPVSVNAQGTFLNQIYMGMFRPDANGLPRWNGNLKQYQFCYNTGTQNLYLCDSLGQDAISSAGTGFISPYAVSFWTSKNTAVQPDSGGGFWRNLPQGAGTGFDSPDGELVEKGGVAQVTRLANLWDDYTAAASTPTNPRNMYTYCPSGSGCVAQLSNSANAFALANAGIKSSMFGASNIKINSIERCVALSTNCTTVNGTIAVLTTNNPHGYSTGTSATITGATPTDYNGTWSVTVLNPTQFTISPLKDLPTLQTLGTYTAGLHNNFAQSITTLGRSSAATSTATSVPTGGNGCDATNIPNLDCEIATATFASAHGFLNGASVNINGAAPSDYSGNKTITTSGPLSTTFTYRIQIYPTTPAVNSYTVVEHPFSGNISSITKSGNSVVISTSSASSFHVGEKVTISGATTTTTTGHTTTTTSSGFNGTWTLSAVGNTNVSISSTSNESSSGGTISPSTTNVAIVGLSRATTAVSATATATGVTAGIFANGDKVDITTTGTTTNEGAYALINTTITCTTSPANQIGGPCTGTTFTYPITVTPVTSAGGTMTAALSAGSVTILAGQITRSNTTATVTGVANGFISGQSIDISTSGTVYTDESAYAGTWTINCPISCGTAFTFGPVTLAPATPATGNISVYSGTAPPDKTSLINWVRGMDNLCDETATPDTGCPNQTTINIRPSLHGDVLHSRPTVVNYGGTTGVVVFYGANDGVYRAINGNQTTAIGTTPAGGELWSFIPNEFYPELTRLHDNSPVLLLASTPSGIAITPLKKDYFVDGASSVYQKLNADGTTNTAYLFLSMRRGGKFIYALDVTNPANPNFLWEISNVDTDFAELGRTFSDPKVAFVKGYANPVLIFGAGYDANGEDAEPPIADAIGRGIYIVDATTGALVWKATYDTSSACSGTTIKAACTVAGMNYSIPSDITLVDRSGNDGYIDRLYAADMGGNIWRVDLEPAAGITPDHWTVTKLASLGCNTGPCASGTTPRKFFYPADVVTTNLYDAVLVGSGDREHPLYTQQSYNVTNRFYMVKDPNTGNDGSNTNYKEGDLEDITTTLAYDGLMKGYYVTLGTGEKVVNAALTVAGYTYFGTNTSATPSANSCTTNLGIAKGYQIQPLTGKLSYVVYNGGGLPPSPVAGSVDVKVNGVDMILPFCIGCGGSKDCVGSDCKTAIGGGKPPISVSTSRSRTYWYKEVD